MIILFPYTFGCTLFGLIELFDTLLIYCIPVFMICLNGGRDGLIIISRDVKKLSIECETVMFLNKRVNVNYCLLKYNTFEQ